MSLEAEIIKEQENIYFSLYFLKKKLFMVNCFTPCLKPTLEFRIDGPGRLLNSEKKSTLLIPATSFN